MATSSVNVYMTKTVTTPSSWEIPELVDVGDHNEFQWDNASSMIYLQGSDEGGGYEAVMLDQSVDDGSGYEAILMKQVKDEEDDDGESYLAIMSQRSIISRSDLSPQKAKPDISSCLSTSFSSSASPLMPSQSSAQCSLIKGDTSAASCFICQICNKEFAVKEFFHHSRRVHGLGFRCKPRTHCCPFCQRIFRDKHHLSCHISTHTRSSVLLCLICNAGGSRKVFQSLVGFNDHYSKVHLRQFIHNCTECARHFRKAVELERHQCRPEDREAHQAHNDELADKAKAELEKWEGPSYAEIGLDVANALANQSKNCDRLVVCTVCSKTFSTVDYFRVHLKHAHFQEFDFSCECCGLVFWTRRSFEVHHCFPSKLQLNLKKRLVRSERAAEVVKQFKKPYYYYRPMSAATKHHTSVPRKHNPGLMRRNMTLKPENYELNCVNDAAMGPALMVNGNILKHDVNTSAMLNYIPVYKLTAPASGARCTKPCQQEAQPLIAPINIIANRDTIVPQTNMSNSAQLTDFRLFANPSKVHASTLISENKQIINQKRDNLAAVAAIPVPTTTVDVSTRPETTGSVCFVSKKWQVTDCKVVAKQQEHWNNVLAADTARFSQLSEQPLSMPTVANQSGSDSDATIEKCDVVARKQKDGCPDSMVLCSACGKEVKRSSYNAHQRQVHKLSASKKSLIYEHCNQCDYRCVGSYKFRRHQLSHGAKRSIHCELCHYSCYEHVDYTHHFKRKHLAQFTIECAACGRGFWKTIALREHRCMPELREENLRLRHAREIEALRARDIVRAERVVSSEG